MLQTTTDVVIHGALDGLAARHRAYVHNVANAETPGFKPSEVPFEAQLRRVRDEMARPQQAAGHAPQPDLTPVPDSQSEERSDGNAVPIDSQVMRLEENSLIYGALIQAAHSRGEILRSAITEGRK